MATRTQTILISDLSGDEITDGGQTVDFAYRGQSYTIDLTDQEAEKFDKAMAFYIDFATKIGGRSQSSRRRSTSRSSSSDDLGAIREWARANGYKVSDRGRISASVREAYAAANN